VQQPLAQGAHLALERLQLAHQAHGLLAVEGRRAGTQHDQ
jgi:hypothetical protein